MPSTIYALVDPRDNKEFYIGRTEDIYQRFIQHLRCQDKNDAKNARIRELQSLHLLPIMRTLEIVKDSALAGEREAYWIRHFRYLGISLTNDIVFSGTMSLEKQQESEIEKRDTLTTQNRKGSSSRAAAKRVIRILKRNPNLTCSELAKKAGVSRSYAGQIKKEIVQ